MSLYDISDPLAPEFLSLIDLQSEARDVGIWEHYAIIADTAGIKVVDISDTRNPEFVSAIHTAGFARGMEKRDEYLFIADGYTGVTVIDVSDTTSPFPVARLPTSFAYDLCIMKDLMFVADGYSGVKIVDVSNPLDMQIIETIETPWQSTKLYANSSFCYVLDSSQKKILTLDPEQMDGSRVIDTTVITGSLVLGSDSTIGVLENNSLVWRDPMRLSVASMVSTTFPSNPDFVYPYNDFLHVISNNALQVYRKALDGTLTLSGTVSQVYDIFWRSEKILTIIGNILFGRTEDGSVFAIDISDSTKPALKGRWLFP